MNLRSTLFVFAATLGLIDAKSIPYDQVHPFKQPEASIDPFVTVPMEFQPMLRIASGCHPYPAVNAAGETSAGLEPIGRKNESCEGSPLGSQVYARMSYFKGKWAIMYAWYFPKNQQEDGSPGIRHDWPCVIIWIDNPFEETRKILAVSVGTNFESYTAFLPPPAYAILGTVTWIEYSQNAAENNNFNSLNVTPIFNGEYQDLITWDLMTEEARAALESTDFGKDARVPFIESNIASELSRASPFPVSAW